MHPSYATPNKKKVAAQLEKRKSNLAVIEETMNMDTHFGEKLVPVRDFLTERIEVLERELRA